MATKILVTGGCGFVGRHLVHRLSENKGNKITIVDDLSTGVSPEEWPEHLRSRIERFEQNDCVRFFESSTEKFDIVFHLAAVVEGRMTIEHNPLKVAKDLMIDSALFRWAVVIQPSKIVYFSSSAAYPINLQTRERNVPLQESMLDVRKGIIGVPDMSYGWSKLTGEFLSYLAVEKHDLKVALYRPFSGFGEDQALTYPFPSIIKRAIENNGGPLEIWGTGEQSRDFIYIEDCITGILNTFENINDASPLNLGTGVRTTFRELAVEAGKVLGKQFEIKPLTEKPEGVFARYCDPSLQRERGFVPQYTLTDGIGIVAEYLKKMHKTA